MANSYSRKFPRPRGARAGGWWKTVSRRLFGVLGRCLGELMEGSLYYGDTLAIVWPRRWRNRIYAHVGSAPSYRMIRSVEWYVRQFLLDELSDVRLQLSGAGIYD